MPRATARDIELELWLRKRNSGELFWTTRSGTQLPLKDMDEGHLRNVLRLLREKERLEEIVEENQDALSKWELG